MAAAWGLGCQCHNERIALGSIELTRVVADKLYINVR